MPEVTDDQKLAEEQAKEYGTYVAKEPIRIGGALAFRKGDAVPVSHVERKVVRDDQVARATTKAGQEAIDSSKPEA